VAPKAVEAKAAVEPAAPAKTAASIDGTPLTAPMPGMIVNFEKGVGDTVNLGETVVILEAMKMENALPAPVGGTIKAINYSSGDTVAKGDVLCVIG
jgi:oxaloacetate decarboxylase alpha subunit/pyruvate carboxylase subunit B